MLLATLPAAINLPGAAANEDLVRRVRQYVQTRLPATRRRIELSAQLGIVTIQGVVRSFYERQLAIACIRRVAGVRQVVDLLVVTDEIRQPRTRGLVHQEVQP